MKRIIFLFIYLMIVFTDISAQDISESFSWLYKQDLQNYGFTGVVYIDKSKSKIHLKKDGDRLYFGQLAIGNGMPIAAAYIENGGMYGNAPELKIEYKYKSNEIRKSFHLGINGKAIVPSNGTIYLNLIGPFKDAVVVEKYNFNDGEFKKTIQPFNYYGSDHSSIGDFVTSKEIILYSDISLNEEVTRIASGRKILIIGWRWIDSYIALLIKSPIGLTGWFRLGDFLPGGNDEFTIKGMFPPHE